MSDGHIDVWTWIDGARGWLCGGWASHAAAARLSETLIFRLSFEDAIIEGLGSCALYDRAGIEELGVGVLVFVADEGRSPGRLEGVSGTTAAPRLTTTPSAVEILDPQAARETFGPMLSLITSGEIEADLGDLVPQPVQSAPAASPASEAPPAPSPAPSPAPEPALLLEVDEVFFLGEAGIALQGWMLPPRSGPWSFRLERAADDGRGEGVALDIQAASPLPRPDVREAVGRPRGYEDVRCGFLVRAPGAFSPGEALELVAEDADGRVSRRSLPAPRLFGLAAIEHVLGASDMQFGDVRAVLAGGVGDTVKGLNALRLKDRPAPDQLRFGRRLDAPRVSLIIPLYRRLDYIETQCALFDEDPAFQDVEILYVLDDPDARREAENLIRLMALKFDLALTLLVGHGRYGFAPASNEGLKAARGETIVFLNSDVIPTAPGWLGPLAARLDAHEDLGVVAPLLLHEDGTVQHQGMRFERRREHGDLWFGAHLRLGAHPPEGEGLLPCHAVTGACMVLRRADALALNGFDEAYVLGDFEDSDLCFRLEDRGLTAAVDPSVRLVHFGRRSAPSADHRWRMNLIVYNAFVHDQRWGERLARRQPTADAP